MRKTKSRKRRKPVCPVVIGQRNIRAAKQNIGRVRKLIAEMRIVLDRAVS